MKIGLLQFYSFDPRFRSVRSRSIGPNMKLLKNAVKDLGHTPKLIREDKCQLFFPIRKPKLYYAGKPFPKVDVVIPKVSLVSNLSLKASILEQMKLQNIPILQDYKATMRSKNKLRTLQLLTNKRIPVPKTIVVNRFEYLDMAIKKVGGFPIILKTPFGSLGKGVVIVESKRALHSAFDLLLTRPDFSSLLIQEYVKEAKGKDIRVFIINNKIIASMERTATTGDFRSNLAMGGEGKIAKLTKMESRIAIEAAKAMNLNIAGVDILRSKHGPVIMEVNCNPGLTGITEVTGINVAQEIVKFAVSFAKKHKNSS